MKQIDLQWLSLLYVVLVKVSQVKGVGDTFGSQFLLYLPMYYDLTVRYDLSLYTLQQNNLKVYLTSHHSVQNLSTVLYVARVRPVLFSITPDLAETKNQPRINTYLLKSSRGQFSLMVYVYFVDVSFESMTAIPVHIWEKRYSFNTVEMNPFVYVVTEKATELRVTLYGENVTKYFGQLKETGLQNYSFSVYLEENGGRELFQMSKYDIFCCNRLALWIESMISPIGVIVGSIIDDPNKRNQFKAKGGFTLEMLLPITHRESGYFMPDLVNGFCSRCTMNYASDDMVVFHSTFRNVAEAWQFDPGDRHMTRVIMLIEELFKLPTQVTYTIYQNVRISDKTESYTVEVAAVSLTIPSTLYATFYFWCTVDIKDIPMTHYAVFIFVGEEDFKEGIELDGLDIPGILPLRVQQFRPLQLTNGSVKSLSGKIIIPIGDHNCYLRKYMPFGLYLYGIASDYLYMHPAGFITDISRSKVQLLYSRLRTRTYGNPNLEADRKENEENLRFYPPQPVSWGEWYTWTCSNCETNQSLLYRKCRKAPRGLIYYENYNCDQESEEDRNEFCSDMCPKNETAAWSQWSEWECSPNCTDTRMIRERHCEFNNSKDEIIVCDGPSNEHKDGDCKSNCPEENVSDCPLGKWGKNCSQLCQFCDQGCSRINGTCQSCLPGYRYPHLGCNEVSDCPLGKWGKNCSQLCQFCHQGCSRINGTCESCLPGYGYPHLGCNEVLDCPLGKWGANCSQLCEFCKQSCNRINGTCESCLPGYRYPHLGCNEACGKFTYGQFCEEDCLTKCDGQDCLDRNEGACPDVPYGLPSRFWLLLLLIPVSLLIYLRLYHRGSDTFEASLTSGSVQNLDKAESKSSIMSRISEWSKTLFRDKSTAPEDNLFRYDEKYGTYV
ncbi:uncharacterized protein LOC106070418 isoform X1 [Biomphalaria glabrata]|uniref:Uncharacterized protein LOC106070418 isoform X1 n=1 Tax=Biomphalaria glabrata TaxID=6526 RepID=A0A9W2YMX5_BIOGL|nr:uncharacterized protein LOC106070418 isoform X1 [Biomphalaria glabrata]